jgi:hypothetical protein
MFKSYSTQEYAGRSAPHARSRMGRGERVRHLNRVSQRFIQPQPFAWGQMIERLYDQQFHRNEIGRMLLGAGPADRRLAFTSGS